jgi:hypothetical protein
MKHLLVGIAAFVTPCSAVGMTGNSLRHLQSSRQIRLEGLIATHACSETHWRTSPPEADP